MRTLTLEGLHALFAEQSDYVWVGAAVLTHPDYSDPALPFRAVNNGEDLTLGGDLYTAVPFLMTLAADTDETVPSARIIIDNVERTLVEALRSMQSPPEIELSLWRVAPDKSAVQEIGPIPFSLTAVHFDALRIEGTLGFRTDWLNEPAVCDVFSPKVAPGLF